MTLIAPARAVKGVKSRRLWMSFSIVIALVASFSVTPAQAAAPTVTSLSPAYGAKAGGSTTVITGTNFTGTTGVTIGGLSATINSITDTSISITVPASATSNLKTVIVTNADGSATVSNGFTYSDTTVACGTSGSFYVTSNAVVAAVNCVGTVDVPSGVTTINACTFGNAAGGNCGTLSGNAVTDVNLPSSIRTLAGASFLGAATMTSIYIPEGLTTIGNSVFYYSGRHPVNIPSSVTSMGEAFYRSNVTEVTFSTPTSLTTIGASTFRASANLNSLVIPEGITSLGNLAIGDVVNPAVAVTWLSLPSTLTTINATALQYLRLTCVINPGNTSFINNFVFPNNPTITTRIADCPAPTMTSFSSASGTAQGGVTFGISGTNLLNVNSVTIGGVAATITAKTATSITVTTPAGTVGAKDVVITTYGHTVTTSNAYTYLPLLTVTSLSVTSGPVGGGTSTVITGTNLSSITVAKIGGANATRSTNTSTSLTITTPSGSAGAQDLLLTNANGTITVTGAFTYVVQTASFSVFSLAGAVNAANYQSAITITATVEYASRITFKYANIRIPGCVNRATPTSAPFTVTCNWKPTRRGTFALTATAVPVAGGIATGVASPINVAVTARPTRR